MLDRDLAALYETETKQLNLAVKRNLKRFPKDFMFQLTKEEFDLVRSQVDSVEKGDSLRLQTVTSNPAGGKATAADKSDKSGKTGGTGGSSAGRGGTRYLPYAFTEQGVAMLSGILHSDKAIQMNIAIMRAFVEVRKIIFKQSDLQWQVRQIKARLGEHDVQLKHIYDALENLLDEKAAERKWDDRERIGFKK
jgi:hypothetical protein